MIRQCQKVLRFFTEVEEELKVIKHWQLYKRLNLLQNFFYLYHLILLESARNLFLKYFTFGKLPDRFLQLLSLVYIIVINYVGTNFLFDF